MSFELPSLTAFFTVFFTIVALAAIVVVGSMTRFFAQNRRVRVRRDQGVREYYGHLVLGH
jgi:hypothetical protein